MEALEMEHEVAKAEVEEQELEADQELVNNVFHHREHLLMA